MSNCDRWCRECGTVAILGTNEGFIINYLIFSPGSWRLEPQKQCTAEIRTPAPGRRQRGHAAADFGDIAVSSSLSNIYSRIFNICITSALFDFYC